VSRRFRRAAVGALALAALLVLPSCGGTDRPEGVVERWLLSLNAGSAGRPGQYAPDALSSRTLPGWAAMNPGQLDVIEVGKGRRVASGRTLVPYRIKELQQPERFGVAMVDATALGLRISALVPPQPGLRVPSQGGPRVVSATAGLWLASLGIAAVLSLLAVALMAAFGGRRPLIRSLAGPSTGT